MYCMKKSILLLLLILGISINEMQARRPGHSRRSSRTLRRTRRAPRRARSARKARRRDHRRRHGWRRHHRPTVYADYWGFGVLLGPSLVVLASQSGSGSDGFDSFARALEQRLSDVARQVDRLLNDARSAADREVQEHQRLTDQLREREKEQEEVKHRLELCNQHLESLKQECTAMGDK